MSRSGPDIAVIVASTALSPSALFVRGPGFCRLRVVSFFAFFISGLLPILNSIPGDPAHAGWLEGCYVCCAKSTQSIRATAPLLSIRRIVTLAEKHREPLLPNTLNQQKRRSPSAHTRPHCCERPAQP